MAINMSSFKQISAEKRKQASEWQAVAGEINNFITKISSIFDIPNNDNRNIYCSAVKTTSSHDLDQQQLMSIKFEGRSSYYNCRTNGFVIKTQEDFEKFCYYYALDLDDFCYSRERIDAIDKIWPELTQIKMPQNPNKLTPEIPILGRPKIGGKMPTP